jgi:hypothetical protein
MMVEEKIDNTKSMTKIDSLEKAVKSEVVQHVVFPAIGAAILGGAFLYLKKNLYDKKDEESKRGYKRAAVDTLGATVGGVVAEAVNPYKKN